MLSSPSLPALASLLQYYCTNIGQYTSPPPTSLSYAIHHKRLVITISGKGQMPASLQAPSPLQKHYPSLPYTRDCNWQYCMVCAAAGGRARGTPGEPAVDFYTILFYSKAFVYESNTISSPSPPALVSLLQYYCTNIGQYTSPPPNYFSCAIHHKRLVIKISGKGQSPPHYKPRPLSRSTTSACPLLDIPITNVVWCMVYARRVGESYFT